MKLIRGIAALLLAGSVTVVAGCGGSDREPVGDDGRVPVVGTSTFFLEEADSTQTQAGDVLEARLSSWRPTPLWPTDDEGWCSANQGSACYLQLPLPLYQVTKLVNWSVT